MLDLSGQAAAVVGASRGIGLLLAREIAARGADLLLASRSATDLERVAATIADDTGRRVEGCVTDVGDPRSVGALAERARRFGNVRSVVNCAAVLGPVGRLPDVDFEHWSRAVQVDLVGTAACCASFAPVLAEAGGGSIVNFSGGGVGGPRPAERISAYTTAKAGVAALTEVLGLELGPLGVRVNAVAPGPVVTGFMDDVLSGGPDQAGEELFARTVAQREHPEPTESLVELVMFLLGPESSGVTGRLLSARWDSVDAIAAWARSGDASQYALRRIDNELFRSETTTQ